MVSEPLPVPRVVIDVGVAVLCKYEAKYGSEVLQCMDARCAADSAAHVFLPMHVIEYGLQIRLMAASCLFSTSDRSLMLCTVCEEATSTI